ncbi:serine/threonine-protein kinase [Nocardia sp. CDC153]|uniref:serine/threonine-protein kinase n=1 Tax=Nocardia sp. CDC153 TaxID=3112167 RepID=UPI002DBEB018|nr:serine/threonine-protein kinase [Nocardia sp. CDC153]MEC3958788.1 serine/threonine-protein kinase [Nocardia sp. CDC153]
MGTVLRPGEIFAGYRIVRLLGRGGMGEVYQAKDPNLPRQVALKVLNARASKDKGLRERFWREANLVAQLVHPNIVPIHARGQDAGRMWIAMVYIEGTDLSATLRRGALEPERAVRITLEIADALDFAHDTGVLHRDVKPANTILATRPRERALLTDFGIAKSRWGIRTSADTEQVLATLEYVAPERFLSPETVGRRADVYSLGCMLYCMLTGELPYPVDGIPALVLAHMRSPIPKPTDRNHQLPPAFDDVTRTALAKHPRNRFATCGELARAAADALAGAPVLATAGVPAAAAVRANLIAAATIPLRPR